MTMPDTPELPPTVELWRPVTGWEDKYEVSSLGRVRGGERLLGQFQNGDGYMLVRLSRPRRTVRVHRLVAEAFVANFAAKPFVNHIDCDRANNAAANLEWCTQAENLRRSESLGRMRRNYWAGKRSPNAALSDAQAREIRRIYSQGGCSLERIGRLFEISMRAVGRIVNMETYTNA